MIWQNGWAALGLLAVAVPILIHLLSRRRARPLKFPTLRFLEVSRLTPTRRTRLSDLLLLAVRAAVVVAAVAALAQPLFLTEDRRTDLGRAVARAIIVDTSASMRRATTGGESAIVAAQREGERLAAEATTSVVLATIAPAATLAGAAAWLNVQPGRRELMVVSDFQTGTLDDEAINGVAPELGVQFSRVEVAATSGPIETRTRGDRTETTAAVTLAPDRTTVDWTVRSALPDTGRGLVLLAGSRERARAQAARDAASRVASLQPLTSDLAVVFLQYDQRAELIRAARPLDQPWMAAAAARVRADPILAAVAARADVRDSSVSAGFTVVARNDRGRAVALAAHGTVDGRDRLLLFSLAEAGSLASAALIAAGANALSPTPPVAELDPGVIPPETLARWQRPASVTGETMQGGHDQSDGRWFWALALVLLAVEAWMRRTRHVAATEVVA